MSRGRGDAVDSERCYLRDIGLYARLDSEEEQRLSRCLEAGRRATAALAEPDVAPDRQRVLAACERRGREARDRIVVAHLRLVVHMARKFARRGRLRGLELLDLAQEGNLGLLEAVEKFESGYGKFSTFATPWIRRKLRRALADQGRVVRLPVYVHEQLSRLRHVERRYRVEEQRPPTPEELQAELGLEAEELVELRIAETEAVSLRQPVGGQEDELVYEDLVDDPKAAAFAQHAEDRQWLAWLLDGVSERSRRILEWHLVHDLTLEEIGKRENVSRQRIRQIKSEALEKLLARHAEGLG